MEGIEPRFSLARSNDEASAIQLAMDAVEIAEQVGPETAFVVLSGNHLFVPLVQRLQRKGHFVLAATLESSGGVDHLPVDCQDAYLNADFLLSSAGIQSKIATESDSDQGSIESGKPAEVQPIEDSVVLKTLESIDAHFGQYEEIYLTPLLRKLSEEFHDAEDEPKVLVNDLEESGAVWLEKRRGFPHNYTVLLLNDEHPDVARLKESRVESEDKKYDDEYFDEYDPDTIVNDEDDDYEM